MAKGRRTGATTIGGGNIGTAGTATGAFVRLSFPQFFFFFFFFELSRAKTSFSSSLVLKCAQRRAADEDHGSAALAAEDKKLADFEAWNMELDRKNASADAPARDSWMLAPNAGWSGHSFALHLPPCHCMLLISASLLDCVCISQGSRGKIITPMFEFEKMAAVSRCRARPRRVFGATDLRRSTN
jgi:hypothetical protein